MVNQTDISSRLAQDSKALDTLREKARQDPRAAAKGAAQQFEALFMNMVMKSMREANHVEGGVLDSEQGKMFTAMLDQQLSQKMAQRGLGLGDVLARQLSPGGSPALPADKGRSESAAKIAPVSSNQAATAASRTGSEDSSTERAAARQALRGNLGNAAVTTPAAPKPVASAPQFANPAAVHGIGSADLTLAALGRNGSGLPGVALYPAGDSAAIGSADLLRGADSVDDLSAEIEALVGARERAVQQFENIRNTPAAGDKGNAAGTSSKNSAVDAVSASTGSTSSARQPAHVRYFQSKLAAPAEEASRSTGIPAKFLLGQAALESGWGRREIVGADGRASHNLFGIKAGSNWKGKVVETYTTEYKNGVPHTKRERFRAYDSYTDAFRDYARLLSKNPRYENVLANAQDATSFARGLQRAGYATDPNYANKLARIINKSLS